MDKAKKKKFISAFLLLCLSGDITTRINYGGLLISRIEKYIVTEVILPRQERKFLISILTGVDKIVEAALMVRVQNQIPANEVTDWKKILVDKIFPIDSSWATEEALAGISSLADLSDIRIARSYYYAASDHYPSTNTSAASAAAVVKNMDRAFQKIVDICEDHDLIEFDAAEWRENVIDTKGDDK
jgi:hypothetical protein